MGFFGISRDMGIDLAVPKSIPISVPILKNIP